MKIKNRKVPFLRRQIGAVFQDFKLLPQKTAYENVAFALQCIGKPKGVIRSQVPEVLRLVGLADQMDSLPDQLSGGEQQRVAVARAMVNPSAAADLRRADGQPRPGDLAGHHEAARAY